MVVKIMRLNKYLKLRKTKPTSWAKDVNIVPELIQRFLNGTRGLSAQTMAKIVAATGGQVTYEDLIAEMQERPAARKNGHGQAEQLVEPGV